jgi:ketosteroid isomerase-like protein
MSQANVEIVRSIFAAWERGDYSSGEWADSGIEFVIADGPTPGSWRGIPAMATVWREALGAFDQHHSKAEGYRPLDAERVLVLVQFTGRGRASGLELATMPTRGANLFHVRDGKVTRLVLYWDRERALEAMGLQE